MPACNGLLGRCTTLGNLHKADKRIRQGRGGQIVATSVSPDLAGPSRERSREGLFFNIELENMAKRRRTFGGSWSWKRASGLSSAKGRLSRKIGIPLTRAGRQRKLGKMAGCCLPFAFLITLAAAIAWFIA